MEGLFSPGNREDGVPLIMINFRLSHWSFDGEHLDRGRKRTVGSRHVTY